MSNNRDISKLFFEVLFDVLGIPNKELRTTTLHLEDMDFLRWNI